MAQCVLFAKEHGIEEFQNRLKEAGNLMQREFAQMLNRYSIDHSNQYGTVKSQLVRDNTIANFIRDMPH